jgi:tRNA A-37 threonylcarbamoyl transferase component Bud32
LDERVVLPVDTVLDGSYRIVRVVGSGGFGITYEAMDIKLQAKIAIKEYYPYDFGHRDVATMRVTPKSERHKETFDWGRANFLLEARTLARFEHPSIVRVSRVYEANSTAYMIMRFEQGQSFENWLRELDRPPNQDELDAIVAPLLDALEVMHAENFLHRDIAPDNIIVRADGTPVLLDFGSARRAVAERSRVLTGIVKAGYSPNEQYASDSRLQGPWSDIYALGGTLYRAVTGRIPEEATLRVTDDRTPAAASIAKGKYRPGFLAAIDASLKVRPADRPQSVAKLRPMLFKPAPPQPRRVTERRVEVPAVAKSGNRTLVIAAILVVLGGALGGVGYARWRSTDQLQSEAEIKRKADREAKQHADAAAAKARADEEALAKAQVEARRKAELAEQETRQQAEAAAAKKRADDEEAAKAKAQTQTEARRQAELAEQEARRQAEAAAAQKRADEEAAARARADDEARRKAELAERERRRQEASLAIASFDGVWEIRRVGSCFSGPPVFGVTIANGMFAQGFGTVSPAGEFKLLGRSQNTGPRDLRYIGTLVGASGSGTFQTEGGTCSGTFTAKRR